MLKLDKICYHYKKDEKNILNNVCANFEVGKFTTIVGPSGSGKTTMLSILAGMDVPTSGTIMIDEENLAGMDLDFYRREKISMIFQAFHLFPLLTVMENVCYPADLDVAKAKELLISVGISEEKHNRYPSNLSGGEQQRVAIARSLSTKAKVILADEPTGNLDQTNSKAIVSMLKNLAHEKGYAVVVVTHDLDIAKEADAVYRMSDGQLSLTAKT